MANKNTYSIEIQMEDIDLNLSIRVLNELRKRVRKGDYILYDWNYTKLERSKHVPAGRFRLYQKITKLV